jgi:hypothetical protein
MVVRIFIHSSNYPYSLVTDLPTYSDSVASAAGIGPRYLGSCFTQGLKDAFLLQQEEDVI